MKPFGTEFCDHIAIARYADGAWSAPSVEPLAPMPMHPAAHVFHYASTCFEGFKAYRWNDGKARIFRLHDHVARMRRSAESLRLPVPDADMLAGMVIDVVHTNLADIPEPPASLYLRPDADRHAGEHRCRCGTVDGSDVIRSGVAGRRLFCRRCDGTQVADHRKLPGQPSSWAVPRRAAIMRPHLGPTLAAKEKYGVDQVLFCPDGDVQETGAANFLLISDDEIITKALDTSFLHGMTRDSILKLGAELGYTISERKFTVEELLEKAATYEACLSGTAATLSPVGTLVYNGKEVPVRDGNRDRIARNCRRLCRTSSSDSSRIRTAGSRKSDRL